MHVSSRYLAFTVSTNDSETCMLKSVPPEITEIMNTSTLRVLVGVTAKGEPDLRDETVGGRVVNALNPLKLLVKEFFSTQENAALKINTYYREGTGVLRAKQEDAELYSGSAKAVVDSTPRIVGAGLDFIDKTTLAHALVLLGVANEAYSKKVDNKNILDLADTIRALYNVKGSTSPEDPTINVGAVVSATSDLVESLKGTSEEDWSNDLDACYLGLLGLGSDREVIYSIASELDVLVKDADTQISGPAMMSSAQGETTVTDILVKLTEFTSQVRGAIMSADAGTDAK